MSATVSNICENDSKPHKRTPCELHRKLDDLEKRAQCLGSQYDDLISRACDLEKWTTMYVSKIAQESKTAAIVELMMRKDNRSNLLLDYMCCFFEIVLKNMQEVGFGKKTAEEMWKALSDDPARLLFLTTIEKLGFTKSEQEAILRVFEVVHTRYSSTTDAYQTLKDGILRRREEAADNAVSGFCDSEVANLFLFLQIQDGLQSSVRAAMRRAVVVTHCGLIASETQRLGLDISSMTAQDIVTHFLASKPMDGRMELAGVKDEGTEEDTAGQDDTVTQQTTETVDVSSVTENMTNLSVQDFHTDGMSEGYGGSSVDSAMSADELGQS